MSSVLRSAQRALSCALLALGMAVAGCSSSSSGGGSDNSGDTDDALERVFIDAAVEGLDYSTDTQSGTTDADGTFTYLEGETVTFSIGDFAFGAAEGAAVLSPWELAQAEDPDSVLGFLNRIAFLQAIDEDSQVSNGIKISSESRELLQAESIVFYDAANLSGEMDGMGLPTPPPGFSFVGDSALMHIVDNFSGLTPNGGVFKALFDYPIVDVAPGQEALTSSITTSCALTPSNPATIVFSSAVDASTMIGGNVMIFSLTTLQPLDSESTVITEDEGNSWDIENSDAPFGDYDYLIVLTRAVKLANGTPLPAPFFWYFQTYDGCS
jgi:hypothetical protein